MLLYRKILLILYQQEVFYIKYSDNIIRAFLVHRYSGVSLFSKDFEYLFIGGFHRHHHHIDSRKHYISRNRISEVHHIYNHLLFFFFNNSVLMADLYHCSELVLCHHIIVIIIFNEEGNNDSRHLVYHIDYRCQNNNQYGNNSDIF